MKLNSDCVREVLLYLEENLSYKSKIKSSDIKIDGFSQDDIMYSVKMLYESRYLNGRLKRPYLAMTLLLSIP